MKNCILMSLLAVFFLTSCSQEKNGPVIGISFETLQAEYWVASLESIKAECERNGASYIESVADGDANRQFEQVSNFISRRVDGIIIAPKDAHTVIPIIKAANKANIPIAIYNRVPVENSGEYITVVADNYEIAKSAVDHMGRIAREKGGEYKAMILIGDLGDINAINRRKGFEDALVEYSDIVELVAEVPTEWNQEKALAGVTNALQANPDINFIFSSSDFLFPSIVSALKNLDKYHPVGHEDHVLLGGFDGDAMAYKMLMEGYLDVDGVQDVHFECVEAVQSIFDMIEGKEANMRIRDPGFVIHQGNIDEFAGRMWGADFASE
ncbi:sugar ABC transporter substrate-binding protein [Puniceicoccaceae bacterium K14]|nr:sugar ABC transporter substrate-binding protein [Puniceicoccaceae bacterium K14]